MTETIVCAFIAAPLLWVGGALIRGGILHFFQTPQERYEIEREAAEAKRFAIFTRRRHD